MQHIHTATYIHSKYCVRNNFKCIRMLVTQVRFWTRPWWKSKWKVQGENATQNCTYINISISASQRYVGYVVIKYKKRKNIKNVSDGLSWVANMVRLMYLPVLQPYSLYPKISRFLFLLLLLFCVLVYVCLLLFSVSSSVSVSAAPSSSFFPFQFFLYFSYSSPSHPKHTQKK